MKVSFNFCELSVKLGQHPHRIICEHQANELVITRNIITSGVGIDIVPGFLLMERKTESGTHTQKKAEVKV